MVHPESASTPPPTEGNLPWLADPTALTALLPPLDEVEHRPVDDCVSGVRLCRATNWKAAAKVIRCGGVPYYEYGELAASRITSCTPQHLRILCTVDDDDPDNPAVHWNKGHLLYQITYALDAVNFYFRWAGKSMCVSLEAGDSVFSLPFVPHSFAVRDRESTSVLVFTYPGSLVGNVRHELSALGYDTTCGFAMVPGSDSYGPLLWSFLDALAMPPAEVRRQSGLPANRVAAILAGQSDPSLAELASLANVLDVNVRDLLPLKTHTRDGIQVVRAAEAMRWQYPDIDRPAYAITRLASDPLHPHTTPLDLRVLDTVNGGHTWLTTYQHQYIYVLGYSAVRFRWQRGGAEYVTKLHPGDTAYIQPGVPVQFGSTTGSIARLLLLRTADAMSADLRFAIGAMPSEGLMRYCGGPLADFQVG